MNARLTQALAALLPALVVLLLYWPVVRAGFVWDDYNYLLHDAGLRDSRFLWRALTQPFLDSLNYFRPLVLISYALEQRAGGSAALSHITNLLLAMSNAVLVGVLARQAAPKLAPAAAPWQVGIIAGLIYAVHPVLVEPIAWISGRFDLACTFFSLLVLWCDRALARTAYIWARLAAMSLLFLLAALCKEAALGLALVLPLWQWMHAPPGAGLFARERRADLLACVGVGAAGVAYLGLRRGALGYVHMAMPHLPYASLLGHAALVFKTIGGFAALVLWPFGSISPEHEVDPGGVTGFDLESLLGVAVLALCLLLAWRAYRGARLHLLPLCALVALVPALNLVAIEIKQNYIHDRFVTLPLVFLALWAGLVLAPLAQRNRAWAVLAAALWALPAAATVSVTVPHWHDDLSLWEWAYQRAPRSEVVIDNLQSGLFSAGDYEGCRRFSEFVRQQNGPLSPLRHTRYALSLAQVGEHDAAVREMDAALADAEHASMAPSQRLALDNESGWLYVYEGYPEKGRQQLAAALARDPGAGETAYFMAAALMVLGDEAGAQPYLQQALALIHPSQRVRRGGELAGFVQSAREHAAQHARGENPQAPEQIPNLN